MRQSRHCVWGRTSRSGCSSAAGGAKAAVATVVATATCSGVYPADGQTAAVAGHRRASKSQVSVMTTNLDEFVADFRTRPLDAGRYTFLAADAMTMRVRKVAR